MSGNVQDATSGANSQAEDKKMSHSQRYLKFSEVVMLFCVELVVVGLFMIPTVYYALPEVCMLEHGRSSYDCNILLVAAGINLFGLRCLHPGSALFRIGL